MRREEARHDVFNVLSLKIHMPNNKETGLIKIAN
jgi:hypothetical protein